MRAMMRTMMTTTPEVDLSAGARQPLEGAT
jgi:hypothetical protein